MADDRLDSAINVVARRVLNVAIADAEPLWEDFPDIGEYDWQAILQRVDQLAAQVDTDNDMYEAAYEYLKGRAL